MLKLNFKRVKKIALRAAAVTGLIALGYGMAHATGTTGPDAGTIHAAFGRTTHNLLRMVMLVSAIAGISFVSMAMFSFKAASDSAGQQNQNLQKGIVKLVLGGALIALPFLMRVSQNSVLQSGMSSSGSAFSIPSENQAFSGVDDQ